MHPTDQSAVRDTSRKACCESSRSLDRVPPHRAVLSRSDGYHYCTRHRCCFVGCMKPRREEKEIWWWCSDHASATSRDVAFNSTPAQPQYWNNIQCKFCRASFVCDKPIEFRNSRDYCLWHRCTHPGCPNSRMHDGVTWTCEKHSQSAINLPSRPIPQNTTKRDSGSEPSNPTQAITCPACNNNRKDGNTAIITSKVGWFCTRHRCTESGCALPRVEASSQGEPWFCSTHQKSIPTKTASGSSVAADESTIMETPALIEIPPKNKRHSRMRSIFHWKSLLSNRKASNTLQPDPEEVSSPLATEIATPATLTDDDSPQPRTEVPDPGWHQCHVPSCQDRVVSEDIWVCEKHLAQGLYDSEDPPGYMDCPSH